MDDKLIFCDATGVKLCDVYKMVVNKVKKEKPKLVNQLTRSFGFASGIEFRESTYLINSKNELTAKKGEF